MKKRNEILKTIQLAVMLILTFTALLLVFTDKSLFQLIGGNSSVRNLSLVLWVTLVLSFIFILIDFRVSLSIKKDYREMDYALNNDRVAGIANRYSCDAIIEKYADRQVPARTGCAMFEIANLRDINEQFGHTGGNRAIAEFASILLSASVSLCFVGRNGGNKYMALFEDSDESALSSFLTRVNQKVALHNEKPGAIPLEYRSGTAHAALEPEIREISQLIACADSRLSLHSDKVTGSYGRADCDDMINAYADKPLPYDMGCLMLEIINIREINENGSRTEGNRAIRAFGDSLNAASKGLCFVGRNGGAKFLALFEECSDGRITEFLDRLNAELDKYNSGSTRQPVKYAYGCAFHEDSSVDAVYKLVVLADKRLRDSRV